MSTFYRAPEIRFLQAQGRLNGTLDPWSDSESDNESFTNETTARETVEEEEMAESQRASVRPYEERDREAVARVCLETASDKIRNVMSPKPTNEGEVQPEHLVPHMWAYSYLTLSPDYCFVLEAEEDGEKKVVGYILCNPDTLQYVERIDNEYIPSQSVTRPWMHKDWKPSTVEGEGEEENEEHRKLVAMLHYPGDALVSNRYPDLVSQYPAHLHINILPSHTGKGYGRVLQERLWKKLREEEIGGVHLECAEDNWNAIAFYRHLGFEEWGMVMDGGRSGRRGVYKEKVSNGSVHTGQIMVKKL